MAGWGIPKGTKIPADGKFHGIDQAAENVRAKLWNFAFYAALTVGAIWYVGKKL